MEEPHFKSVISDELLPESDLTEVKVKELAVGGLPPFEIVEKDRVFVESEKVPSKLTDIQVLICHNELVSVYTEVLTYGGERSPDSSRINNEVLNKIEEEIIGGE